VKYGGLANLGWQFAVNRINGVGGEFLYGFNFQSHPGGWFCTVPHWFAVLLSMIFAVVPWLHWSKNFSLRTLLIVTTLIAAVLGLIVYAVGNNSPEGATGTPIWHILFQVFGQANVHALTHCRLDPHMLCSA
jgi:hypothetical protein